MPHIRIHAVGHRQKGAALLALVLLFFIVGTSFVLGSLSPVGANQSRNAKTASALAQAKAAVIAYAANSTSLPGRLPCPEDVTLIGTANEGNQLASCSNTAPEIGRLPWRTIRTGQLLDGFGEPLWYVLSPNFRAAPINSNTVGQLTVDAQTQQYAALIISAGPPQSGQDRTTITALTPPSVANYLDGTNANADVTFSETASGINDRILGITVAELMAPVTRRVLAEIRGPDDSYPSTPAGGLRNYHAVNSEFPYADSDGDGNADASVLTGKVPYQALTPLMWLNSNQWYTLVGYNRVSQNCARLTLAGAPTVHVVPCTTSPCPTNSCP